jgi:Spy/CpxP family protein refolding chaperone
MAPKALLLFSGLALAWLLSPAPALAQPREGFGFQDRFQQIKRAQLGPALGVDQSTVERLLQIDQRYTPLRQKVDQEAKSDFHRLQQVMSQPSPSEAEVEAILNDIRKKMKEKRDLQERQYQEEMVVLTPIQQARYILYLHSLGKEARTIRDGPGKVPYTPGGPREMPVTGPPAPAGR